MKLRILGGTPPNHETHLCDTCTYRDRLVGSHMDEQWCGARRHHPEVKGKVYVCSMYEQAKTIPGTRYRDAWVVVSLPKYGPCFLTPWECKDYDECGRLPDRFRSEDEDGGSPTYSRRNRARRRYTEPIQ
jgi:hypothetical protein